MAISLGLYQGLHNLGFSENIRIKWPNDIYIGQRKVAGILIENTLKSIFMRTAIAGIGFNVNQENFSIDRATSLKHVSGRNYDLESVLETLLLSIEAFYLQLKQGSFDELHQQYEQCLLGKEERLQYMANEASFYARVQRVDKQGKLYLEDDAGKLRQYSFKEVALLWP